LSGLEIVCQEVPFQRSVRVSVLVPTKNSPTAQALLADVAVTP
jgi:hypothetical protein